MRGSAALGGWSQEVGRELDDQLRAVRYYSGRSFPEGTVSVHFVRDADGRAEAVTLADGSGNRWLDRVALGAVARLEGMQPLPAGSDQQRTIRANIVFANDLDSYDRQVVALHKKEAVRIARERASDQQLVVIGLTRRTQS